MPGSTCGHMCPTGRVPQARVNEAVRLSEFVQEQVRFRGMRRAGNERLARKVMFRLTEHRQEALDYVVGNQLTTIKMRCL